MEFHHVPPILSLNAFAVTMSYHIIYNILNISNIKLSKLIFAFNSSVKNYKVNNIFITYINGSKRIINFFH